MLVVDGMNTGTMCCSWVLLVALSLPCLLGRAHSLLDSGPAHSPNTYQGVTPLKLGSLTILPGKKQEDMVGLNMEDLKPTEGPEMLPTPLPLKGSQPVVPESSIPGVATSSREKPVQEEDSKDCVEKELTKLQDEKQDDLLELTKPAKDKVSEVIGTSREGAVVAVEDSQGASDQYTLVKQEKNVKKTVPRKGVSTEEEGSSSVPRKGVGTLLTELDVEDPPSLPRKGVETAPGGQSVPRKGVNSSPPSVVPKKGVGEGPESEEVVGTGPKSASVPRKGVEIQSVPRKGVDSPPISIPKKGLNKEPEIPYADSSVPFRPDEGTAHTSFGNGTQVVTNSTLHNNNSSTSDSSRTIAPITANMTQSSPSQPGEPAGRPMVEPHLNETVVLENQNHTPNKPPTSDEAFLKSPYGDNNAVGTNFSLQVFGIVLLCVIVIGGIIGYNRLRDVWMRRHYARVDFLVDGMYQS